MNDCSGCIVKQACRSLPKDLTCDEVRRIVEQDGQETIKTEEAQT